MRSTDKRPLMISNVWIQAAGIVLIIGFFIMGMLAFYTYNDEPPIPSVVKTSSGALLFTGADVIAGQRIFLQNGLMEYGSIFGHGAYLGPDFTAQYLHRSALSTIHYYARTNSDTAKARTIEDFKTNRFDKATGTLIYTDAQAHAFEECRAYYASFFGNPTTKFGLRRSAIQDPEQIRKLTAFFSWTAWAASAARPGHSYSYTNNWPPEPLVANHATADAIVWSVLSLAALLGGTGLLLAVFGRWNLLGWHGREQQSMSFRAPDDVLLTPAQKACAWFFFVMAALFFVQTLVGGATEHYQVSLTSFYGIDLATDTVAWKLSALPGNLVPYATGYAASSPAVDPSSGLVVTDLLVNAPSPTAATGGSRFSTARAISSASSPSMCRCPPARARRSAIVPTRR